MQNREYGYRKLTLGETIADGDEVNFGHWTLGQLIGGKITGESLMYRRKIDPGAGYRLLGPEEIVVAGDEYFGWHSWHETQDGKSGVLANHATNIPAYRRRICAPTTWTITEGPDTAAFVNTLKRQASKQQFTIVEEDVELLKGVLLRAEKWLVSGEAGRLREKYFPKAMKKYRLLSVGEIICSGDDYYSAAAGAWRPVGITAGNVVTENDLPIRREINEYTGGPA